MEVVPFALVLTRAARRSSEWWEAGLEARPRTRVLELVALAFLAPLVRPERGARLALDRCLRCSWLRAHLARPTLLPWGEARAASRVSPAPPLRSLRSPPKRSAGSWTGHLRSNTALVKLLPGNPYYVGPALLAVVHENFRLLTHTLLNGEVWFRGVSSPCGDARRFHGPPRRRRVHVGQAPPLPSVCRHWARVRHRGPVRLRLFLVEPPSLPLALRPFLDRRARLPRARDRGPPRSRATPLASGDAGPRRAVRRPLRHQARRHHR